MLKAVSILAFAVIFISYPTYDYFFDDLTFAMAIEGVAAGGNPAWLLHPHHLLFSPLIYFLYTLAQAAGIHVRSLLVMQVFTSLVAAAGLWFFAGILDKLRFDRNASLAGMVLLGSLYNYWHLGTMGDNLVPACVTGIALMWFLTRNPRPGNIGRYAIAAGLIMSFGILMHQTAAVFFPAAVFIIWRKCRPAHRTTACAVFFLTAAAVTAFFYLAAGIFVAGLRTPSEFLGWILGYFGKDPRTGYMVSYSSLQISNITAAGEAWFQSLFGYWPFPEGAAKLAWLTGALLSVALFLWCITRAVLAKTHRAGPESIFLKGVLVWIVAHALFFLWWSPGLSRFWILSLPGWCLLTMVGARVITRHRILLGAFAWFLVVLVEAVVFSAAALHEMRPSSNRFLPMARQLAEETPDDATIVISGVGKFTALKAYVPYFARRRMLILDWQFADKSVPAEEASAALLERIAALRKRGPVYLLSEAVAPDLDRHFREIHGVSLGKLRKALKPDGMNPQSRLAEDVDLYKL